MQEIHPKELKGIIDEKDIIIIDIRPKRLFEKETLKHAISMPSNTIEYERFSQLRNESNASKIIIMCSKGVSSKLLIENLHHKKDCPLYNLTGGFELCKKERLPLVSIKNTSLLLCLKNLLLKNHEV